MHHRSPRTVLDDHLAALNSGDADRIAADYADDAAVLLPGTAVTGRAAIRDAFADNADALPGAVYAPVSVTEAGGLILLEWSMATDSLTVTDGIDTFLVSDGLIQRQTSRFTVTGQ